MILRIHDIYAVWMHALLKVSHPPLCASKLCGLGVILISLLAFIHFVSIQLADLLIACSSTVLPRLASLALNVHHTISVHHVISVHHLQCWGCASLETMLGLLNKESFVTVTPRTNTKRFSTIQTQRIFAYPYSIFTHLAPNNESAFVYK